VFSILEVPAYKVFMCMDLDFWIPTKTPIRVMFNFHAHNVIVWKFSWFRSSFFLDFGVKFLI
jgi:hypothetical protein